MPPRGAHREDLRFAPAVGARQAVHRPQGAYRPVVELRVHRNETMSNSACHRWAHTGQLRLSRRLDCGSRRSISASIARRAVSESRPNSTASPQDALIPRMQRSSNRSRAAPGSVSGKIAETSALVGRRNLMSYPSASRENSASEASFRRWQQSSATSDSHSSCSEHRGQEVMLLMRGPNRSCRIWNRCASRSPMLRWANASRGCSGQNASSKLRRAESGLDAGRLPIRSTVRTPTACAWLATRPVR